MHNLKLFTVIAFGLLLLCSSQVSGRNPAVRSIKEQSIPVQETSQDAVLPIPLEDSLRPNSSPVMIIVKDVQSVEESQSEQLEFPSNSDSIKKREPRSVGERDMSPAYPVSRVRSVVEWQKNNEEPSRDALHTGLTLVSTSSVTINANQGPGNYFSQQITVTITCTRNTNNKWDIWAEIADPLTGNDHERVFQASSLSITNSGGSYVTLDAPRVVFVGISMKRDDVVSFNVTLRASTIIDDWADEYIGSLYFRAETN